MGRFGRFLLNKFSGDIRDAHLALVKSIRNRPAYFAELLYNSMKVQKENLDSIIDGSFLQIQFFRNFPRGHFKIRNYFCAEYAKNIICLELKI